MGFIQPKHFVNNKGESYIVRTALPKDAEKVLRFNQTTIFADDGSRFQSNLCTTKAIFKTDF